MTKKIGILTGGGDVQPLNAVLAAVSAKLVEKGGRLLGFHNGWQGLLDGTYTDLTNYNINPNIGGTLLKSSRVNLRKVEKAASRVTDVLSSLDIDGLIVIGGEDTLSNAFVLPSVPQVLISKTIDNDVGRVIGNKVQNYFTLGYPTAAERICSFIGLEDGVRTTAYSHERIVIVESMGMHAGWLAMSSAFGNPDLIVIPEFPLNYEKFKEEIIRIYKEQGHVIAVIAEGSRWDNGKYISASDSEMDSFGHPKFIGVAQKVSTQLKQDIAQVIETRNINYLNPSYLYRSGAPNQADKKAAAILGSKAVDLLCDGLSAPTFLNIELDSGEMDVSTTALAGMENIEDYHRFVTEEFYNPDRFFITDSARKYLSGFVRQHTVLNYGLDDVR